METLSTLDAGFYFVEHENVPMHIGSLAIFEGPAPSYADFVRLLAAKLPLVPRYRQVVRTAPLHLFRPVWADDQHFEIGYHVRHSAVPRPGGAEQLRNQVSRILAQRLDPRRPLWEAWLFEGISGGRWALLSKVHHCVVDGIGGSELMTVLFDLSPEYSPPEPAPWDPEPARSALGMLAVSAGEIASWPARRLAGLASMATPAGLASLPGLARAVPARAGHAVTFGVGLAESLRRLTKPAATSLNGPIGPHRRWAWTTASLADAKRVRGAFGGTVNDVVLAAITSGFRDLLKSRGELAAGTIVRTLVPVSVRDHDERGVTSNRISALLANLPVAEADPVRRLELISGQMSDLKRHRQAVGAELLTGMLGFAAPTLLALGSRAAFRIPQPLVQTVTTNVPGPRFPLYVMGRRMTEVYPYVPIGDNLRISVAIFSYTDDLSFGITADYAAVPDLDVLTAGIGAGLAELAKLASAGSGEPAREGKPGKRRPGKEKPRAGRGDGARKKDDESRKRKT